MEATDVMGDAISRGFDHEAAFVVFLFAAGYVVASAVLAEQPTDLFRLSGGVPLLLLAGLVAHGGHSS